MLFAVPGPVNGPTLVAELAAAGIADATVTVLRHAVQVLASGTPDEAAAAAVVATHTGAATAEQVEAVADRATVRVTAAQAAKARQVRRGESTFTAAQQQQINAAQVLEWWHEQGGEDT